MDKKKYSLEQLLNKILYFINYRIRSQKEVTNKLTMLGADEEQKKAVLEIGIKNGLINDEKFISAVLKDFIELKQYGLSRAKTELSRRGYASYLIEDTLQNYQNDNESYSEEQQALLLLKNKYSKNKTIPQEQKMQAFLGRRGFSYSTASKALKLYKNGTL